MPGHEHPNLAACISNLAVVYEKQGKYPQAESFFLRGLDMEKKMLGENHPEVADSLNNLAVLYAKQGKYPQAESLLEKAWRIVEGRPDADCHHADIIRKNRDHIRCRSGEAVSGTG